MTGTELTSEVRKTDNKVLIYLITNEINFEETAIKAGANGVFTPLISKESLKYVLTK